MATSNPVLTTWKVDPSHSSADFTVRHMMISNVKGQFGGVSGSAVLNTEDLSQSSVDVVIDVTTIDTHDAQRDAHLKSADFLETESYPKMTFRSTAVEAAGEGELRVKGDLTIRGVTRPVVLAVEGPTSVIKDPWGNLRWGATATTKINRKDFGLTWNVALEAGGVLVSDEIRIDIGIQFTASPE